MEISPALLAKKIPYSPAACAASPFSRIGIIR